MGKYDSRFFVYSDPKVDFMIYELPPTWWSRYYEYAWASKFTGAGDVVLDAGCGICHPFKFYLSDVCKEVHACDLDKRILSTEEIVNDILNDCGNKVSIPALLEYCQKIHFKQCNLTSLPYDDKKFDKIFCISVLEHMNLQDIKMSLQEFKRTLKENGFIVLTFDYPNISLEQFMDTVNEIGLNFAGRVSFNIPKAAVTSNLWGKLYCYRTVLKKRL
ncbi:class I SAM-dependent methyltransferase [Desulforamulus putei]|uniref:Methyltransferase domain-containing protein n=1 Tax=Desulforamulus putei DSM 12395 TaxID=1121429 RepID=A0A1M4S8T4_9FIRM|nr:class I SAM-dependent methyltransferase [Desulforamulus putei]SHE28619.1 Methyltransferase domain-containing protein [Desulforamulus putei DSM 12395]